MSGRIIADARTALVRCGRFVLALAALHAAAATAVAQPARSTAPGVLRPSTPSDAGVRGSAGDLEAPGALAGVRLVAAEPAAIRFTVDVAPHALLPLESDPSASSLVIDGFETLGLPGEPAIPRRIVNVAVPPEGRVSVSATGLAPRVVDGVLLAPAPMAERGQEATPHFERRAEAYVARVAPERARLVGVSWMRDQRVAQIEILPADWDPAARRLTVHGAVDVRVSVEPFAARPGVPFAADAFERVYAQTIVNYEQGRAWRRDAGAAARSLDPARAGFVSAAPETSVFAGRTWAKIAITQTGFYKVDYATLRTLGLLGGVTARLDSIRAFTWPGFPVLPENSYCDSCDYRELAIQFVESNANDTLDTNAEYLYFFAMGPSDWADRYDPALPDTVFINNPYELRSYVYLTVATPARPVGRTPRRIATRSGAIVNPAATTPATYTARSHFELDAEYFPDPTPKANVNQPNTLFWEKWYWRSLSVGQSFTATADVPGADTGQPVRLRLSMWGLFSTNRCTLIDHTADVSFNGLPSGRLRRSWNLNTGHVVDTTFAAGVLAETGNSVRVEVPFQASCPARVDRVALAWFDLFYERRFEAVNGEMDFVSPQSPGDYIYRITGFTSATPPRVFDVTDAYGPVEVLGFVYEDLGGGAYRLSFQSVEPGLRRYRIVRDANIVRLAGTSVVDASSASLDNLRSPRDPQGAPRAVDYLVIYYDGFKAMADSLVAWRRTRLPLAGSSGPYGALAVPVSALYDQFSGGRADPAAIRNFLRSAFFNWPSIPGGRKPAFVTLLADASYDFKNYTGRAAPGNPGTLLPSYEGGYDFFVSRQYATDDWLLNVDDPVRIIPDFFGGRIPVADVQAARTYVLGKLFPHERSAPVGDYRNRVMFIGDDDKQGAFDDPLRWVHVSQNAVLDSSFTPEHVDRRYVYLHKFPDGPGDTKPGAKAEIIRSINEGVAIVNFIGHGSPFKMTDESVFLDTDTGTLTNGPRQTVFVAASCDIGKYNDPAVQSLGERLVLEPAGGAVGVISATELALSNQNAQLNRVLYRGLFRRDSLGGPYRVGLAEALVVAKVGFLTTEKYQLMGDAAVRLNLPRLWADVSVWDSAGVTPVTEVRRGQTVTVRGQVLDWPGGSPVSFSGVAGLLIEDSAPLEITPPCTFDPNCGFRSLYYHTAGPMYRGDVAVAGGSFEGRFVVPLEAKLGPRGRVRAYLSGRVGGEAFDSDGVGTLRTQMADGAATGSDTEGPRITLTFPGGATAVKPDAVLQVDLFDPSGILTTGHTTQNGIIVTLDDNTTARVDITSSFRYAADSYQSGTAFFQLPNLAPGPHRVRVSAADNLAAGLSAGAHRSSATLDFEVVDVPPVQIRNAYLFPNPTSSKGPGAGGQFVVDTPGDSVNVLLRVYTVSGKLVRELRALGGIGQVQLPWDGRDEDGAPLANGVYFFKVHANPRDETGASDPSRKATRDGRLVIVNR